MIKKTLFFLGLVIGILFFPSRGAAAEAGYPITGTFFMNDVTDISVGHLEGVIQEMADTGIDTIVILASGALEKIDGIYREHNFITDPNNLTREVIKIAHKKNIDLYVGLVSYDYNVVRHWVGVADDPNTDKGRIIDLSLRLVDSINDLLRNNSIPQSRIKGYYLGETGPNNLATPNTNELVFWKEQSIRLKQKAPDKKLLISPYVLQANSYSYMKSVYENIYRETAIDIIAPQDSMGSLKVTTYEKSAELFRALHDATAQFPGREAWANIETQLQPSFTDINYKPSSIERIWYQVEAARPYVTKMITWIYQHTMLSQPAYDDLRSSWTAQYTPSNAVLRKKLRQDYKNAYLSPNIFEDVPPFHFAYSSIKTLVDKGITDGCQATPPKFCPDEKLTRSQVAVLLLKSKYGGSYIPLSISSSRFIDVPANHWAATWISKIADEGISSGCGEGKFCPDSDLTWGQIAILLLKAKYGGSYAPPKATGVFADVPASYYAADWIEQLRAEGITSGCSENPLSYCPDQVVTRSQAAILLVNTFGLKDSDESFLPADINKDRVVNMLDVNILISEFDKVSGVADVDKSGKVDIFDYNLVIGSYGK